ncbi:circularly permutated Ras protein 1 isoform X2 [Fundulus heteroclitus]|nr:circularly permutated Ras protein 1 isoform X2 [Fundulus heteroclitus]XP_021179267.2 circularly permutated Ras protein 1 isoform X2 [Fundulus heteroclitus]XP_036002565.1 circularly permutated Ras protein 1 isoform X2 [Fundulus heteroclitus]XP_036002566.1 circularly permutated Ras protein 1 isoform X2 [Fundulus heteroclitus]
MEFACSHVVCNWGPDGEDVSEVGPDYENRALLKQQTDPLPPPLPPRRFRKPRPTSLPNPPFLTSQLSVTPLSLPPPVPPRLDLLEQDNRFKVNINVVSLGVGKLADMSQDAGLENFQSPVICGKCSAALSCLSSVWKKLWVCEFCGYENGVDESLAQVCIGQRAGVRSDDLYLPGKSEDDYQNLEDTMVVFCVDISGSMTVTTEVTTGNGSTMHISRLEGIQDALQRTLTFTLQQTPHRRVALVTFNDEVVIYGDGTRTPLTIRDWALVDYEHIWKQAVGYNVPHCIAETYQHLTQRVKELRENGATALGPATLASVALASKYPGSKVILCTDGRANIGLGDMEQAQSSSADNSYFYRELALQAVQKGVIISVMSFKGTDCRLADIGRLADVTGGRVNIVSIGTVATEIQSISEDNVLATSVTATLLAPDGVYFPYEDEHNHKLVREIGNVTKGLEITFEFAVKPDYVEFCFQRNTLPFQLQLSFKTRDQQKVTRIITEQRPVTIGSQILLGRLNMAVLGVYWAQLCAGLTVEGRVKEARRQLAAQQDLLRHISKLRPIQKEESIYGNWMETMTTICGDITTESQVLSDEAAEVVYQMKRASSISSKSTAGRQKKTFVRKKPMEAM